MFKLVSTILEATQSETRPPSPPRKQLRTNDHATPMEDVTLPSANDPASPQNLFQYGKDERAGENNYCPQGLPMRLVICTRLTDLHILIHNNIITTIYHIHNQTITHLHQSQLNKPKQATPACPYLHFLQPTFVSYPTTSTHYLLRPPPNLAQRSTSTITYHHPSLGFKKQTKTGTVMMPQLGE